MRRLILIPLTSLLLNACGQTGPLYLPEDQPAPAANSAPEAVTPDTVDSEALAPAATDAEAE
jgi:predicted small lipoprotein YifL